jgi:hypothetical protein
MDPFRGSRARRFARNLEPRMVGKFEVLSREGWRISWEPKIQAHLLKGPGGQFLVVGERKSVPVRDDAQTIVVVWREFPAEVDEVEGVFVVHGDALLAFLRSQADLVDGFDISGGD